MHYSFIVSATFCFLAFSSSLVSAEKLEVISIGFSNKILGDNINENDAMAAVKTWTKILAEDHNIPANPSPLMFNSTKQVGAALKEKKVDFAYVTLNEVYLNKEFFDLDVFLLGENQGSILSEYYLLVHKDSGIEQIEQLKGKSLIMHESDRMSLAPLWLETTIAQKTGAAPGNFFQTAQKNNKLNKVLIPVFFQKTDACLVSREGFKIMSDLNPQIASKLKIIASSEQYVPAVLLFRADYTSPLKQRILQDMSQWILEPSGQQMLTIFRLDNLILNSEESLKSSFDLVKQHQALYADLENNAHIFDRE